MKNHKSTVLPTVTIFLGSFLSFFVQPLVGRTILPYFGGSATVWVTCLVAFQLLLLVGYGYAFVPSKCRARSVHLLFVFLAGGAAMAVPVGGRALLSALVGMNPLAGVILAVLAITGLVSVVLNANSTVVQSWTGGGREVYRLYAIGNIGSFAGLLAYPLAAEPFVPLSVQWAGLGTAILVYGVLLMRLAIRATVAAPSAVAAAEGAAAPSVSTSRIDWLLWALIPALSCAMMTSVTTYLTTDFTPLPLVWAVILAAFLLSYVIGFSKIGEGGWRWWASASVAVTLFAAWALMPRHISNIYLFYWNVGAASGLLLVTCTALHAWLCRIRPNNRHLPHYYFAIALGGAVGGSFAGIAAPLLFTRVWEYPITVGVAAVLIAWRLGRDTVRMPKGISEADWANFCKFGKGTLYAALAATLLLLSQFGREAMMPGESPILRTRGFYGTLAVLSVPLTYDDGHKLARHCFYHGQTVHGFQVWDDKLKLKPTLYYSLNGGGIAYESYLPRKTRPTRSAVVGMGLGTMAAYGRTNDYVRCYEISPDVTAIATNAALFTFLSDSKAKVDVVVGDARLEMERDRAAGMEKFDIIVLDAYSGDSIPTHLITKEAFELYRSMLVEGGVIALHLSNWHIDLLPVVKAAAKELGMSRVATYGGEVLNEFATETEWAFFYDEKTFKLRAPDCCDQIDFDKVADRPMITDACGSMIFNIHFSFDVPLKE